MLFFVATVLARCTPGSALVHPGPVHSDGGFVVVDLSGVARSMAAETPLFIGPKNERVAAEILSSHQGLRKDQMVLRPTEALRPGSWRVRLGDKTFGVEVAATQLASPSFPETPALVDVSTRHFGCGPSIQAAVDVGAVLAGRWVEVELQGPGGSQTALVQVDENGMIRIGHGMCGGLFRMDEGQHEAELRLLSAVKEKGPVSVVSFEVQP